MSLAILQSHKWATDHVDWYRGKKRRNLNFNSRMPRGGVSTKERVTSTFIVWIDFGSRKELWTLLRTVEGAV